MSQHTQGEWKLTVTNQTDGEAIIYTGKSPHDPDAIICEVAGGLGFDGERCQESDGNARLITAAPVLLKALQTASNYLADDLDESDETEMRVFNAIRAALAEAEVRAA